MLPSEFKPPYTAVTKFMPTGSAEVVKLDEPLDQRSRFSTVVPFIKLMVLVLAHLRADEEMLPRRLWAPTRAKFGLCGGPVTTRTGEYPQYARSWSRIRQLSKPQPHAGPELSLRLE